MNELTKPTMTENEARQCCEDIKESIGNMRELVLDLHDRRGWIPLGYKCWKECVQAEFNVGANYIYKELTAGRVEQRLIDAGVYHGTQGSLPERQAREIAKAPEEKQAKVWEQATNSVRTGEQLTAKRIREIVETREEPEPEAPVIKDAVGNVIEDDELAFQYTKGQVLAHIKRELSRLRAELETHAKSKHGRELRQELFTYLNDAIACIKFAIPYAVVGDQWYTKDQWKALPKG